MDELNCTHDCSTCGSACSDAEPAEKDIFTRMEDMSKALHDDDGYEMLEKLSAALDEMKE